MSRADTRYPRQTPPRALLVAGDTELPPKSLFTVSTEGRLSASLDLDVSDSLFNNHLITMQRCNTNVSVTKTKSAT